MSIRPRYLLPLLLALTALPVFAQQEGGLQQRMSKTEFTAAGLDKLSPQELTNLNTWLSSHRKVITQTVNSDGHRVFYTHSKKRIKFTAHIAGPFNGWNGHSEFTLDNGQVWKQRGSDEPSCMTSTNPEVIVKPSILGSWLMYVHGCDDSVHVTRIH